MRDFTVKDFEGSGQYLVRLKDGEQCSDTGFLSTVMYKVGYQYKGKRGFHTVYKISMADGLIFDGYRYEGEWIYWEGNSDDKTGTKLPKQKFVEYLNDPDRCTQEYRFATQEEVTRVVMSQDWR